MSSYNAASWLVDRHVVDGNGDRVAIRHRGADSTYAEVLADMWRAQNAMQGLGLQAGDRVAMVVNDEPAFVSWFLGAQRSGLIPVPLSTMLMGPELAPIVADAGAKALVLSEEYVPHLGDIAASAPTVTDAVTLGGHAASGGPPLTVHQWGDFTDRSEADVACHHRRLASVLVVQLRHDRGAKGCDASPWQPRGHRRDVRGRGAPNHRARPVPLGGEALLRLRPRELADVPLRCWRNHDPRRPATNA